jgi:hypothetical protein
MKSYLLLFCLGMSACHSVITDEPTTETWLINSFHNIGGAVVNVQGNPRIVDFSHGKAVRFDGEGDRLLIDKNPLANTAEFTIEIIFNPAAAFPANAEPRFFHIEAADNPSRRVTIELRLNNKNQWYLDAYIKSEQSQLTLIDPSKVHPVNQWAHAAITYKDREFISYVNGKKELTGQVDFLPITPTAKTSIGARMNQVHWYKGDIAKVRISHQALEPARFLAITK